MKKILFVWLPVLLWLLPLWDLGKRAFSEGETETEEAEAERMAFRSAFYLRIAVIAVFLVVFLMIKQSYASVR